MRVERGPGTSKEHESDFSILVLLLKFLAKLLWMIFPPFDIFIEYYLLPND